MYAAGQQPESSTLSLLGELLDSTGRTQDALTYYRDALRVDPKNAVAHAGIGLILLGTSNFNYASEHACGLNHEEALDHLQKAYQLDSTLQPVHDALMFCAKEISEVKFWRNVLSAQNEQSSSSSSSSSAASLQLKTSSSDESDGSVVKTIIKKIIQPVRMAKQWVYMRLQQFGICVELNTNANSNTNGNIRSLVTEIVCKFFQPSSSKQTKLSFADSIKATLSTWAVREEFLPQVPHVTIDSADELQQLLRLNRPVVITNFQEKWDGSSSSNTKSKFDFSKNSLLERFGSEIVRVSVSESGRFDGPENGTLWGLGPSSDVLVRPPQTSMLLGDFITLLENSRYPDSIANETFYAEYLALHQYLGKVSTNDYLI